MPRLPAINDFRLYLANQNLSVNQFARQNQFDSSELHKLLTGKKQRVSVELAAKIEDATGGSVRMRRWIPL